MRSKPYWKPSEPSPLWRTPPQLFGTRQVEKLDKSLLLIHGDHDTVLPHAASEDIFERAVEPKRLVLMEGAGHSLRERPGELFDELEPYLLQTVGPRASD